MRCCLSWHRTHRSQSGGRLLVDPERVAGWALDTRFDLTTDAGARPRTFFLRSCLSWLTRPPEIPTTGPISRTDTPSCLSLSIPFALYTNLRGSRCLSHVGTEGHSTLRRYAFGATTSHVPWTLPLVWQPTVRHSLPGTTVPNVFGSIGGELCHIR